ncbi:unnamed protein product [Rotaria socialis]|uniref:Uncharacterized protein n=1 Tax=Rotaria socialis TaxID=392032 RepID=A0A821PWI8_9BILA|nr:unnamed protein product [Rotaria socialis]CAF4809763.1 unnamed protein product [Rotaria socialis]
MSSSACSQNSTCRSNSRSASNSTPNIGRIVGVAMASILALCIFICAIVITYFVCCRKKRLLQIWAQPWLPSRHNGPPMPMNPYIYYPQRYTPPLKVDQRTLVETQPPAYEMPSTIDNRTLTPIENPPENRVQSPAVRQTQSSSANQTHSSSEKRTQSPSENRTRSTMENPTEYT